MYYEEFLGLFEKHLNGALQCGMKIEEIITNLDIGNCPLAGLCDVCTCNFDDCLKDCVYYDDSVDYYKKYKSALIEDMKKIVERCK